MRKAFILATALIIGACSTIRQVIGFSPLTSFHHPTHKVTSSYSSVYKSNALYQTINDNDLQGATPLSTSQLKSELNEENIDTNANNNEEEEGVMKVTSPLKFIGPYPSLPLHFPTLSTPNQKERNMTGISLDFIMDTAANTNTIQNQVAQELELESLTDIVVPDGYSASGPMDASTSNTYILGNCTLDYGPAKGREIFMTELTASALPIASPAASGLISVAFMNCFQGGVKFHWGTPPPIRDNSSTDTHVDATSSEVTRQQVFNEMNDVNDASVTFYGENDPELMKEELIDMDRIPIQVIEDVLLPSVLLNINGVDIPCLLDTGSPITVLNSVAAKKAGLTVPELFVDQQQQDDSKSNKKGLFSNPFQGLVDNFNAAKDMAQAVARGDVVLAGGAQLRRIQEPFRQIGLVGENYQINADIQENDLDVSFSKNSKIYVGDLPGLVALGGLNGADSSPAAILGMDLIRQKSSMLYRPYEVFFSKD